MMFAALYLGGTVATTLWLWAEWPLARGSSVEVALRARPARSVAVLAMAVLAWPAAGVCLRVMRERLASDE